MSAKGERWDRTDSSTSEDEYRAFTSIAIGKGVAPGVESKSNAENMTIEKSSWRGVWYAVTTVPPNAVSPGPVPTGNGDTVKKK